MSSEKTDAMIIRLADWSESSKVVTFFSRDFGKISAVAKGAKRLKGPFEAAIDLLAVCRIVFIRKSSSGLDILTEAQLQQRFKPNGRNLLGLYGGYYVAELLSSFTEEYDPNPELYDIAVRTLSSLSDEPDHKITLLKFELALLRETGHLPLFDACMACGKPAEAGDARFGFWVSQGGLICRECQKREHQSQPEIQTGTLAILRRLSEENGGSMKNLQISDKQYAEMRRVVTASIRYVMGRDSKMSRYLRL
ncbi:DNA repair protein RecO [Polystyrenella longa]|uniref:DNA repair protein RecO n=1 Tax=Polystyrenella longa TaxID=2528007 RepID=A0A518CSF9_9PLAN|nr:DNA repair protein RecO [Polystyrenella longa]QDU82167.1 DNA repair protein RecO [Polystyrenella longa]